MWGGKVVTPVPLIIREDILEMDLLGEIIKSGEVSVDELTKVLKCEIEEYEKNFSHCNVKTDKSANQYSENTNNIIELLKQRFYMLSKQERNIVLRKLIDVCDEKYSRQILHNFGKKSTYDIDCTITVVNDKEYTEQGISIIKNIAEWGSEIIGRVLNAQVIDFINQSVEINNEDKIDILLILLMCMLCCNYVKK